MAEKLIPFNVSINDPGADARVTVFEVPAGVGQVQVVQAIAECSATVAEHDTNFIKITLQDGGADGTGTTAIGAELTNLATGSNGAWTAATPKDFTVAEVLLDEGDRLMLKYDEGGTVAPGSVTVSGWLVIGKR
jgi:hypothetical protein